MRRGASARPSGQAIVLFDVCDTLVAENTTFGFLRHLNGGGGKAYPGERLFASRYSPFFLLSAAALRFFNWDLVRQIAVRSLKGRSLAELRSAASHYASDLLASKVNEAVLERLTRHRDAGDRVVLVSSSLDVVVEAIADEIGVEYRASELEFRDGVCTGRLKSDLTGAKDRLVGALREESGAGQRIHVYTDNFSDARLVAMADHRYVIIPPGRSRRRWGKIDAAFIEL